MLLKKFHLWESNPGYKIDNHGYSATVLRQNRLRSGRFELPRELNPNRLANCNLTPLGHNSNKRMNKDGIEPPLPDFQSVVFPLDHMFT